jgi:hypothetical protein
VTRGTRLERLAAYAGVGVWVFVFPGVIVLSEAGTLADGYAYVVIGAVSGFGVWRWLSRGRSLIPWRNRRGLTYPWLAWAGAGAGLVIAVFLGFGILIDLGPWEVDPEKLGGTENWLLTSFVVAWLLAMIVLPVVLSRRALRRERSGPSGRGELVPELPPPPATAESS